MVFARMTALSAMAALAGAGGLYAASTPGDDGQDRRRVVIERDGDGPGLDIFATGGSRVGMVVRDVETADVAKEKLAGTAGAVVTEVGKESAAQKAGIKAGDVVTTFDGERVRSARQLVRLVEETPAGRTVKVAVQRAGAHVTVDVTPEAQVAQFAPGHGCCWDGSPSFRFERRSPEDGPESERPGRPVQVRDGRTLHFDAEPFMPPAAAGWASVSRTCPGTGRLLRRQAGRVVPASRRTPRRRRPPSKPGT